MLKVIVKTANQSFSFFYPFFPSLSRIACSSLPLTSASITTLSFVSFDFSHFSLTLTHSIFPSPTLSLYIYLFFSHSFFTLTISPFPTLSSFILFSLNTPPPPSFICDFRRKLTFFRKPICFLVKSKNFVSFYFWLQKSNFYGFKL